MSRRAVIWLLGTLLFVMLAPLAAVGVLGGTNTGTRWLFDAAKAYLPETLTVGSVDGTLFSGVVIRDIAYDGVVDVDTVEADLAFWALPGRRLVFSDLVIDGVAVAIESGGAEPTEPSAVPEIDLPFVIELPNVRISDIRITGENLDRSIESAGFSATFADRRLSVDELGVRSAWLGLDGSARLLVAQDLDADASLRWRFTLPSDDELAGTLSLRGSREGYDVEHRLSAPASIVTRGRISIDPELVVDLDSNWDEWRLPIADDQVLTRSVLLSTAGSLTNLDVELTADVFVADYPDLQLALTANTDLTSAEIETLEVGAEGALLLVDGRADWSGEPSADIRYRLTATPDLLTDAAPPGQLELNGRLTGQFGDTGPTIAVAMEQLSGTLNGQPVTGEGSVNITPTALDIAETRLALGDNHLSLAGSAGDALNLTATLAFGALSQLDDRLAGSIDGNVRVQGPRAEPAVGLTLESSDLAFGEYRAARAEFAVDYTNIDDVRSRLVLSDVRAATLAFMTVAFEQTGGADSHQFRFSGLHESGSFSIEGDGTYVDPDWNGSIRAAEFTTEALSDWSLTDALDISVTADGSTLSPFCLTSDDGPGRVCGELSSRANSDLSGKIEVRRFPLAALPVAIPGDARLAGYLEAVFDIERTADVLTASGGAETVDASIETVLDGEPYVTTIDAARLGIGVIQSSLTADLDVQVDAGAGTLNANLDVDDALSGESPISGDVILDVPDLATIAFLFPDIANPTGSLDARAQIRGTREAPVIESRTSVRDAAFDVLAAGIRITDMSLTMEQRDLDNISIVGKARSGDGELTIEGASRLSAAGEWSAGVRLFGEDFALLRLPDWTLAASPDVRVEFGDDLTRVRGSLTIPSADISVKTVPETATAPSTDVVVHGGSDDDAAARRAYDVDVTTVLGETVSFSGFGLSTGITGELRVTGTDDTPIAGTGRLELRDGRYRAYGQNLIIERGDLTFNGPLDDPQLDVRAVRPIDDADIVAGIRITGTPGDLRSDVFTEPPMSDAEALSYVLTGRPLSGGQTSSDADLLNKAAFALGLSKAGSVAAQIRAGLGLDTLEVDGADSEGRIVAGKRIGDRLLVEYGYGFIDKLGTLLLRYQLTSRIILESRTGSVSALDVVYSVKRD